ncbi:MAG: glycogen/starch synthase [Dehalococcoidia bacterium]
MNVLFASAEMSPLAKVGGLGDVAGSLPRALRQHGLDVRLAMPFHAIIDREQAAAKRIAEQVRVPWAGGDESVDVWLADVRGVPVYLIENQRYFDRPTVYGHDDDIERFLFFCDALLACADRLDFRPDAVHAQDWHTALLLTRLEADDAHPWSRCGRAYTIHNLALKGEFTRDFAAGFGLGSQQFAPPDGLPEDIMYSAMAQGIAHAQRVNTVSETYAKEILTPEYGAGLDPLLRARGEWVSGIVNGIDYEEFDTQTDAALETNFNVDTLDRREQNKHVLQATAGLPIDPGAPLFGVVTRLFAQKGIDLVSDAFDALLAEREAQLVVLGTGDQSVHEALQALEARYPQRVKVWLDFNPPLGQQIYGGCDVFMMPSRYEPCGLGQLISLRYGAVPLVRRTGGLNDTVQDADPSLTTGTGFIFEGATARDLREAAERALTAFANRAGWRAMQERGMRQDWSWGPAADNYAALYETAIADRGARVS